MAKYRIHETRFIAGHLYSVTDDKNLPVIEVPDDFPAGMGMEPLDAAAKKAVEEYEKKAGVKPVLTPVVVKEISVKPVTDEFPTNQPFGPVSSRPDLLPKVRPDQPNDSQRIRPESDKFTGTPATTGGPGAKPVANVPPEKADKVKPLGAPPPPVPKLSEPIE